MTSVTLWWPRVIIYDRNMFIIQPTDRRKLKKKNRFNIFFQKFVESTSLNDSLSTKFCISTASLRVPPLLSYWERTFFGQKIIQNSWWDDLWLGLLSFAFLNKYQNVYNIGIICQNANVSYVVMTKCCKGKILRPMINSIMVNVMIVIFDNDLRKYLPHVKMTKCQRNKCQNDQMSKK